MDAVLSAEDRDALARLGTSRRFSHGSVLFHEGDDTETLFLVVDGRVKVSVFTPSGREVVLAIKMPGELLGELAVIDGRPRSAAATALDRVEVITVAASSFEAFLDQHPHVAVRALLRDLSRLLRETSATTAERDEADVTARVARRLLALTNRFAEHAGSSTVVPLRLTHDDLAGWVGSSRETVSRVLGDLRDRGLVRTGRGRVAVVDPEGLRDVTAS